MKIAIAQLTVSSQKSENIAKAFDVLAKAKAQNADMVVFPEVFMIYMGGVGATPYAEVAEPLDGPFVGTMAKAAREHGMHVVFGMYESKFDEKERCYNTVVVLDDAGTLIHSYRKTHLYNAFSHSESKNMIAGDNGFEPFKTKFGTLGVMVCYELRFPEISRTLALKGAEMILVPTAWVAGAMKEEHLLSMAKARALENTIFMGVADQVGNIYAGRSVIYNPMGVVMASRGEDEGLIFADIDLNDVHKVREKLPCLSQRRPELYKLD